MKFNPTALSVLALAFFKFSVIPGYSEDTGDLEKLRFEFQVELAGLEENTLLQELNTKYRGYLEKQKATYQQEGKLEAMLAAAEELKNFESGPGKELSTYPELKRLQGIYREQRQGLEQKQNEKKLALFQTYAKKANGLSEQWTRDGKIEGAKLALAEAKRFTAMAADPALLKTITTPAGGEPGAPVAGGDSEVREAGEEMRNGIGMKLCWIPAGKFTMGSPETETDRNAAEEAQVEVELTRGFWIGKHEVTQEEYEEVTGANPSLRKGIGKWAPVEKVTWEEAMAFCESLTEREGKKGKLPEGWVYRLPTEAQWEYACRAGEAGPYSGGALNEVGWYKDNSGETTHAVGEKTANAWGLRDMHGNVREWCLDWMSPKLAGGKDPTGPQGGSNRIARGGGWYNEANYCRSANRDGFTPSYQSNGLGLRVCLVPTD